MKALNAPEFPLIWQPIVEQAANGLRRLALNEEAKAQFCYDPNLRPYMQAVAKRYVAGESISDVVQRIAQMNARGHAGSAEYMGESCRDEVMSNCYLNERIR